MKHDGQQNTAHLTGAHLTYEELIAVLYEVEPPQAHLADCAHCVARLDAMRERRETHVATAAAGLEPRALAKQRAEIYSRLDSGRAFGARWLWAVAPVAAAAALFVTIGMRSGEAPAWNAAEMAASAPSPDDAAQEADSLYSDIYESLSVQTPGGVYAVAGMFDPPMEQDGTAKN